MNLKVQHQIARMILPEEITRTDAHPMGELDVRIIASSKVNLRYLVEKHEFSEGLYYMLQGLLLEIPALNQRKEDLLYHFEVFFKEGAKKYNKYPVLTQGARKRLQELAWSGNILQLQFFCERLVLAADKRSIDEVMIQTIYDQLYPYIRKSQDQQQIVIYHSPEADEIEELMEKHHGNRVKVAEELGISTTTLWRKMKKYGVEAKYRS